VSVSPIGEGVIFFIKNRLLKTQKGDDSLCKYVMPTAAHRPGYSNYNKHLFEYQ